jgi:hypothetical protein
MKGDQAFNGLANAVSHTEARCLFKYRSEGKQMQTVSQIPPEVNIGAKTVSSQEASNTTDCLASSKFQMQNMAKNILPRHIDAALYRNFHLNTPPQHRR